MIIVKAEHPNDVFECVKPMIIPLGMCVWDPPYGTNPTGDMGIGWVDQKPTMDEIGAHLSVSNEMISSKCVK